MLLLALFGCEPSAEPPPLEAFDPPPLLLSLDDLACYPVEPWRLCLDGEAELVANAAGEVVAEDAHTPESLAEFVGSVQIAALAGSWEVEAGDVVAAPYLACIQCAEGGGLPDAGDYPGALAWTLGDYTATVEVVLVVK